MTGCLQTPYGPVWLRTCGPRIMHVRLFGPPEVPDGSYVGPGAWGPCAAAGAAAPGEGHEYGRGELHVATAAASARLLADPLRLTFLDADGQPLLGSPATGAAWRERVTESARGQTHERLRVQLLRAAGDEMHCYGLGEGGGGLQMERLGTSRLLWNSHVGHGPGTDMAVPLLVCIGAQRAFGLFFDTTAAAHLDVGRSDRGSLLAYEAETSAVDLYFLAGPTPADVLGAYAELTGQPPLPPRWALGYVQSTRHWDDTQEIRALARALREKRIPCDALVFLSTYGEAKSWNVGVGHLEFEPDLWSNPAALMAELREDFGYRVVTHEYPVLHPEAKQFAEADHRGFLLEVAYPASRSPLPAGPSTSPAPATPSSRRPAQRFTEGQRYVDFSHPEARWWWWAQHRELVDLGVAGWWLDGGEGPPFDTELAGGPGRLLHNAYDLLRMRAFADGEARDRPDHRPWLLCRSGGAGMQRHGAASWSGDINTTFATLEAQVPLGLNTGMSGVPYWGTDIGGFFPAALTGELYARWFQFGALCPLFRAHGWEWRRHVPWAHGPEVEGICRRYAELRMRLLPYLYTLAWRAHTHGEPLMRPLVYHYPGDANVWELGSQYLLGPDLLVAPVTRPGATHWPVYVPAGEWYDFWTHARYEGSRGVSVPAPLDTLPLLVRGGALLPMGPVLQRSDERPLDELTLLVYPAAPGQSAESQLYEDDGATHAYRRGERAITTLRCLTEPGQVRVEVGTAAGRYQGQPAHRTVLMRIWLPHEPIELLVVRGDAPAAAIPQAEEGGRKMPLETGATWWREGPHLVWVHVPNALVKDALTVQVRHR